MTGAVVLPAGRPALATMRAVLHFGLRDACHDLRGSILSALLLFSLLAPVAALHALQSGVVAAWAEALSRDVRNSEVRIRGEVTMQAARLAEIAAWPETGFLVPAPSAIVMTQSVRVPAPSAEGRPGLPVSIDLRTSVPGDPALFGLAAPAPDEAVLSRRAAEQIAPDLAVGGRVELIVRRQPADAPREVAALPLAVTGILPQDRWPGANVFLHPDTARAVRDWKGFRQPGPAPDVALLDPDATWESLRIYAPTVREAPALAERLEAEGFDTVLNSDQVAQFVRLEDGIRAVFSGIVACGALALVVSVYLLQSLRVSRQRREIALMGSIGLGRRHLVWFPVVGALIHAVGALVLLLLAAPLSVPALARFATEQAGLDRFSLPPVSEWLAAATVVLLLGAAAARLAARPIHRFPFGPLLRED